MGNRFIIKSPETIRYERDLATCSVFAMYRSACCPRGVSVLSPLGSKSGPCTALRTFPQKIYRTAVSMQVKSGGAGNAFLRHFSYANDLRDRLSLIQGFLVRCLKQKSSDAVIEQALPVLYRQHSVLTIEALSEKLRMGRRQLERRWIAYSGHTPKETSNLSRSQHTIRALMLEPSQTWYVSHFLTGTTIKHISFMISDVAQDFPRGNTCKPPEARRIFTIRHLERQALYASQVINY